MMATKKNPLVSVIVLNWNGIGYTKACIASLKKQSYQDFEIVVVDNGSTKDDSVAVLKRMKGIRLVLNPKNLGFAGGNNVGVRASLATRYIALLNNDTVVPANWLSEMVSAMERYPELGQAMSKVYNKYSQKDYHFDFYGTATHMLLGAAYDFPVSEKRYVPIFSSSGGALIYRKELVQVPFDDDYFIYHEDNYFAWLLRLKGYKVGVVPTAIVYHEGEATVKSTRAMSSFFAYLGERNRMMNLFLFYSPLTLLKLLPVLALTTLFLNVYDLKKVGLRSRAYVWLLLHLPLLLKKRRAIQRQRVVSDAKILPYLSAKLFEERHFSGSVKTLVRLANRISFFYGQVVGLHCVERNRSKKEFFQ